MMDINALLNKYKNILINALVVLIALFIAFNFIYKKQQSQISSLSETAKVEEKKNLLLDDISQMENKINAYSRLLEKKDAGDIINAINEMAKDSNIKIISIRPVQEQNYADYAKTTYELSVQADTYHSLGAFTSKVENNNIVFIVNSLDIHTDTQGKGLLAVIRISSITYK